jgi:hypothetical protein
MNSTMTAPTTAAKEWDEVRTAFASSIMVDTGLASLAQNLDGLEWPLKGSDETPAGYIDLNFEEALQILRARGLPNGVELLTRILRETMAFDEPFGEMVKQTEESARRDNPLLRSLSRLNIPENFPLTLTTVDDVARELCRRELLETVGQFALFAQGLSQSVIVGGDFRRLLNALAHVDEVSLAELMPFRVGTTGLHLAEALAQAARAPNPPARVAQAIAWFSGEFAGWRECVGKDPQALQQALGVLNNVELEERISALLVVHLPSTPHVGNWWSSFKAWFKA